MLFLSSQSSILKVETAGSPEHVRKFLPDCTASQKTVIFVLTAMRTSVHMRHFLYMPLFSILLLLFLFRVINLYPTAERSRVTVHFSCAEGNALAHPYHGVFILCLKYL
jgi:hypothetical protein